MTLRLMRPPLRFARLEPRRRYGGATPGLCGFIRHSPVPDWFETRIAPSNGAAMTNRLGTSKGIETCSSCHCLKQTEAAKGAASKQQPQRVDARREHQYGRSDRHSRCLPIRIGGPRHHDAAGDDEPGNYRHETSSYDRLPARMAEAMPEPISAEIDQARRPEGGAGSSRPHPESPTPSSRQNSSSGSCWGRAGPVMSRRNSRIPGSSSSHGHPRPTDAHPAEPSENRQS